LQFILNKIKSLFSYSSKKFFRFFFFLFFLSVNLILLIVSYLTFISQELPSIEALQNYKPVQVAKIISADGKPLKDLYIDQKRDVVEIGKVPKDLRNALVFMEDRKFFEHPGTDIWGLIRAVVVNITGGSTQGASTLTWQLARNMYNDIGFEKTYTRKIKEFITASNIEQTYTKSEIMELYLNSVFFGHRAYGIQEASKYYFNKDVSDLELNESATLVGLLPAPNRYSPKKNINTVIGHSKDFIDKIINQNFSISSSSVFTLTKIDGKLDSEKKINISDILFLNNNYDTIPISYSQLERNSNNIIFHDYQNGKLSINVKSDEKIKYYKFKVSGFKNMSPDGVGGGLAEANSFIEINNSSRALSRKNLVLKILEQQNYINENKRNLHTLLPIMVSNKNKERNNIASYFIEDVKKELLGFRQAISREKIENLLPYFPNRKNQVQKWIDKNYGMNLNFNGDKFDLYKDGLRVYSSIDTRIQSIVSDIFKDQMKINQINLYNDYKRKPEILDTVIMKSKNRKLKELKRYYSANFSSSIKNNIINQEIDKWKKLGKTDSEIEKLISEGLHKGERFFDINKNGKWDKAEEFIDAKNGKWDKNESFKDWGQDQCPDSFENGRGGCLNEESKLYKKGDDPNLDNYSLNNIYGAENNDKYDIGEKFVDAKNGKWDIGEEFIDINNNNKYDKAERFIDGNKQYNLGERFNDKNGNGKYDPDNNEETWIDIKNGRYDPDGFIVKKISREINRLALESLDSLDYSSEFIMNILKPNSDSIIPNYLRKEFLIQGAVVVLDVETGNIISMIGGRQEDDYFDFFNRSSQALRQPGSIFKPFVYMGGIKDYDSKHPFTAAYQLSNSSVPIPIENGEYWNPRNFDGKEDGKDMTLREGLTQSTNLIAAGLIAEMDNGPDSVKKIAQNFGISTPIYAGEALSLGATDVIPLEITSAYSAIANDGLLVEPSYINKIENSLGRVLMSNDIEQEFAEKNEGVVYIIRDMMKDVIKEGTARSLKTKYKFDGNAVAGKTGTTNNFTDAWFIGFTPQLAIGVWVGMDNPAISLGNKVYGSKAALPIFAKSIKKIYDYGKYSLGDDKVRNLDKNLDWYVPDDKIKAINICDKSKLISKKGCYSSSKEFFLKESLPTNECDIPSHRSNYK